ncbi:MAG: hypothetical protein ACRBN8_34390 [Nannocystales bacterium]
MKKPILTVFAFALTFGTSSLALAEWSVSKHPLAPGYRVTHDSGSPGLVVNKVYKTKRGAKKAAKALNDAEKKSDGGNHGTGD